MRLLDFCCGAGGAARGFAAAGFEVVGIDLEPQPNYPYPFFQGDAVEVFRHLLDGGRFLPDSTMGRSFGLEDFVGIHFSAPCQRWTNLSKAWNGNADAHPDLIAPLREMALESGLPYVAENVPEAPLRDPVRLCGSSFGLDVRRHRNFETNWPLVAPPCNHRLQTPRFPALRSGRTTLASVVGVFGTGGGDAKDIDVWKRAMRIDWMQTKHELAESIPPAYTEFVGRQLWLHIRAQAGLAA